MKQIVAGIRARRKILSACGVMAVGLGVLMMVYGYEETWRLWNIDTMMPHFADLRNITSAVEAYALGYDPMKENPTDPWQRRLNYPRIWHYLSYFGIDQSHTTAMGIVFIVLFVAGVCMIMPEASTAMVLLVSGAVLSPAILLGIERGNVDLLLFFLLAVAVCGVQRSYVVTLLAILAGVVLKFYLVFGAAVMARAKRPTCLVYLAIIAGLTGAYVYAVLPDLRLMYEATPKGGAMSYGMNVLWVQLQNYSARLSEYARLVSYVVVVVTVIGAVVAVVGGKAARLGLHESRYIDAFRAGAAIYVGTFVLGNNWDYRLMFLIFVIPQLVIWLAQGSGWIRAGAKVMLVCMYFSMWYGVIKKVMAYVPYGREGVYVLEELSNWVMFAGLLYMLVASLPSWMTGWLRGIGLRREGSN